MSSSTSATTSSNRNPRVLACVLCQHRKIKCDRLTPCSNCLKANVTCTPSTPAPARKRRRPNQDLQERLARCEQLLKQYAGGEVPSAGEVHAATTPSVESTTPNRPGTSSHSPMFVDPPDNVSAGKMFQHEKGVHFSDSRLWSEFYEELQAMRQIIDTEDPEEASILGSEGQTPTNSAESNAAELLFPPDNFSLSLSNLDLQPDPAHIFSLWQIFLDRVNPITKLIHVPSLQPYVVEATTNPANVPLKYRALLFSIYLMATISLSDQECTQLLGIPREQALQQFSSGTTKALIKCDYLRNYDMAILQCLSLFLYSLQGRSDRHAAWIFSGTVTRIARKMGYHRDGEFLNLTPFETEMRRRIWWQVLTQDAKLALVSGLNHKFFNDIHDTKQPLNLNDADLFPGSTEPVQSREGPTEMAFVLICCRLATFLVTESSIKGYETAILGEEDMDQADTHHDIKEKYRVIIRELEQDLLDIEQRYCDPSAGNAHIAALSMRQALIQKFHDMLVPMREQPEWGTELFCAKDNLFKLCLLNIESSIDLHERMANLGFAWAMKQDFQFDLFAVLTGQLYKRPTGTLPDRGWIAIEKIHDYQPQLFDVAQKHYAAQAAFTLKAWKARERGLSFSGLKVEVPAFITKLRESLGHDSVRTPAMTPPKTTQMQQTNGLDEFLGGYLDVSSLDWDMWGDVGGNGMGGNQQPISASLFGGFVNMGNMGGM